MIYKNFKDKELSQLGFGAMRLPVRPDGSVDEALTAEMTAYAMEHGVNYFDTAYPYHDGQSESVLGRVLSRYDRASYYLATKFPGHQTSASYDPKGVFEEQLKKCRVEYFDFYLLHNVCESSLPVYLDPQWGIIDYFKEQKRLGRIRHLGFSTHGSVEMIRQFLDICGEDMEFCQIQLNYLDWSLQDAKGKYELLTERGIPVWVMEPVRGGKLAKLGAAEEQRLKELRPEETVAAWGFHFLQKLPNVTMVLSGMSNMEQLADNIKTFEKDASLTEEENALILEIAEGMKDSIPCTACRYCCAGCPAGLDIPMLLNLYNELKVAPTVIATMRLDALPEDKQPSACIGCGACSAVCPQGIDIPEAMKRLVEILNGLPKWADVCKEREEAQKRMAQKQLEVKE